MTAPHRLQGIVLLLVGIFLFAVFDATSKYLAQSFPVQLLVWARYSVNLVIMLIVVVPSAGRDVVITRSPWLMILRGVLLVTCTLFLVLALRTLPLAETSALAFLSPLLVVLLAGPLLGEEMKLRNWIAAIGGFVGMLLIARPGGAVSGIGVVYALSAALCNAFYQILTRRLSATESPMRQLFYTALVGTVIMTFLIPPYWTGTTPTLAQGLLIASLGCSGGGAHFLLIRAFRDTPASTLAPLLYIQLIWAMLLGWLVFGQFPDGLATCGMLIIGASGLSLALYRPR